MVEVRKSRWKAAFALAALVCLAAPFARASNLPAGAATLLDHTQLVNGSFSSALDFISPAAGQITVVLTDLAWPSNLGSLQFGATDATNIFGKLDAAGSLTFDVGGPGHFFAIVSGHTQSPEDFGLYSLKLQWTAAGAQVPVPAAGWLLASGVASLLGLARRRREAMV